MNAPSNSRSDRLAALLEAQKSGRVTAPLLVTAREAADFMRICGKTFRKEVAKNIPRIKRLGKRPKYDLADIIKYIDDSKELPACQSINQKTHNITTTTSNTAGRGIMAVRGVTDEAIAKDIAGSIRTKASVAFHLGVPEEKEEYPSITIDEAMVRYWNEFGKRIKSHKSDLRRMQIMATLLGKNKDIPFEKLDNKLITTLIGKLCERTHPGKNKQRVPIAPATVNRYIEALRRIWKKAATVWDIKIGREPLWKELRLREPFERVRELTADEEAALFANLREDMHPIVRFALISGIRLGNLISLCWSQIDFAEGQITIMVKSLEPGGKPHRVPISTDMRAILESQRGNHPRYVFTYVCKKSRGGRRCGQRYPYSRSGWRKDWAKALQAAGIEDYRFHDNRHTAATRVTRKHGNLKITQ